MCQLYAGDRKTVCRVGFVVCRPGRALVGLKAPAGYGLYRPGRVPEAIDAEIVPRQVFTLSGAPLCRGAAGRRVCSSGGRRPRDKTVG